MSVLQQQSEPVLPEFSEVWQQTLSWQPSPSQQVSYQCLYHEVIQANQQLNLTRITEPQAFWEKHLWDSLRGIQPWLSQPNGSTLRVIDVGTGGGFPGIPIAIALPQWQLTLLDSTRKKIAFLEALATTLNLPNVQTQVDRAEQAGQSPQHRQQYDLALIRAVATAPICAEYTLPLLKLGGTAILYRGQWLAEEAEALQLAATLLGGKIEQIDSFTTPLSQGIRHCVHVKKVKPTPATYPRAIGVPTQKPL